MTIISGNNNYTLATLLSQTANKQASTAGANTSTSGSAAATGSATTAPSAKTVAQAIAAAANSASYDFATVGQNARTVLNAGISAYGQTPDSQTSQQDWVTIFGGMDRRSLFAVSSNQGGQFSPLEQQEAKQLMDNQLANAAGSNLSGSTQQQISGYTAQVNLLNNASPEEKQTATWAYSMADAQTGARMADMDARMPQASGGNASLLNVMMSAMYNTRSQSSSPVTFPSVNSLSEITSQSWAQNYAAQIQSAFASSYSPGTSYSASV
jgi:hypothetical protein